jgi:hypothetical protein
LLSHLMQDLPSLSLPVTTLRNFMIAMISSSKKRSQPLVEQHDPCEKEGRAWVSLDYSKRRANGDAHNYPGNCVRPHFSTTRH